MDLINRLIHIRRFPLIRQILILYGVDIPKEVEIGKDFSLLHGGVGTVINPRIKIGDRVRIYHNVTIGRADAHLPISQSKMQMVEIGDDAILFPGSIVLGGPGITRVGNGTIVGANSLLLRSTGDYEVWAGSPAKRISPRRDAAIREKDVC